MKLDSEWSSDKLEIILKALEIMNNNGIITVAEMQNMKEGSINILGDDEEAYNEAWEEYDISSAYGKTIDELQKDITNTTGVFIPLHYLEMDLLPRSDMDISPCCNVITDSETIRGEFNPENKGRDKSILHGCEKCGKFQKEI